MEFKSAMEQAEVNYEVLLSRFSGNSALMERFVKKFPQDPSIIKLGEAVEAGDFAGMEAAAHTLKGVSANLGFDSLSAFCNTMVQNLRSGVQDNVKEQFEKISQEYMRIKDLILQID